MVGVGITFGSSGASFGVTVSASAARGKADGSDGYYINSAHSCYGTGATGSSQVEILTPSAPKNANQNNSNLIRYEGGKRVDNFALAH